MSTTLRTFLFSFSLLAVFNSVAAAQDVASSNGEDFIIELRAGLWMPTLSSDLKVDSGSLSGTNINVVRDLGYDDKKSVPSAELTIKFAERHKLRFDYLTFAYSGDKVIGTQLVFNGVTYPLSTQIKSDLELRSIKAAYEYDLVRGESGYFAFRLAGDYVYAKASVDTMGAISNSASASAVAPVVGLSGRLLILPWVSVTADICGVAFDKSSVYDGQLYLDVNLVKNLGLTAGYRTMRIDINVDGKRSDTQWSGAFAGLALRL